MAVSVILRNYPIIPIAYVLYGGKKCWITTDTLSYRLSNGQNYTVEKGFRFDGTSSPRFLWSVFPQIDDSILAVILHDHMYMNDYLLDTKSPKDAKEWIDHEFKLFLDKYSKKPKKDKAMFLGVDLFGWKIFNRRKDE